MNYQGLISEKVTEKIHLYNCDNMELLRQTPDNYYELAITDPPYGIGENGSTNKTRGKLAKSKDYKSFAGGDISAPNKEYFNELKRVSKNQIIWGANHFIENISNKNSSCWIVWDKVNGLTDFADSELAYTSFNTAVRNFRFQWQGMLQGDMKNKEVRVHPTQKPVKLYEWLLINYAKQGDKVLDTHLGSMSIAIAVQNMNTINKMDLTLVGCELDEDYFKAGVNRFNNHIKQKTIFDL